MKNGRKDNRKKGRQNRLNKVHKKENKRKNKKKSNLFNIILLTNSLTKLFIVYLFIILFSAKFYTLLDGD